MIKRLFAFLSTLVICGCLVKTPSLNNGQAKYEAGLKKANIGSVNPLIKKINETRNNQVNILFYESGERDDNGDVKTGSDGIHTNNNYRFNNDSFIVIYKDFELLVDCGIGTQVQNSETINSPAITNGVNELLDIMKSLKSSDSDTWDMCLFTHRHVDHIRGAPGIMKYSYNNSDLKIDKIYDFALPDNTYPCIEGNIQQSYVDTMKNYENKGGKHIPVMSLFYDKKGNEIENPKTIVNVDNDLSIHFLTNDLEIMKEQDKNNNPNNTSVSFYLQYKNQKMLFTGDAEDKAINVLTKKHKDELKNVTLYKAGHHGAENANPQSFINLIRPEYIVIPTVAGSRHSSSQKPENYYPSIAVADYFFKYTDYIYAPSVAVFEDDGDYKYASLYGDILFTFDGDNGDVFTRYLSDNNYRPNIPIQSTKWFSNKRDSRFYIYSFNDENSKKYNCTLYKYGHYDILIDCGSDDLTSTSLVEQLKDYIVDGEIEYLVVTSAKKEHISQLVGTTNDKNELNNDGVLHQFKIDHLIDFGDDTNHKEGDLEYSYKVHSNYKKIIKKLDVDYITLDDGDFNEIEVASVRRYGDSASPLQTVEDSYSEEKLLLKNIDTSYGKQSSENNYSITTTINFFNHRSVFLSDLENYSTLIANYKDDIENADYVRTSSSSCSSANSKELLDVLKGKTYVMGSAINNKESDYGTKEYTTNLVTNANLSNQSSVYVSSYIDVSNSIKPINNKLIYSYSPLTKTAGVKNNDNGQYYIQGLTKDTIAEYCR